VSGRGDPFDDLVESAGAASPEKGNRGARERRDPADARDGRDERDGSMSDWPTLTDAGRPDAGRPAPPRPGEDSSAVRADDSFRGGDSSRPGLARSDTEENVYVILPDQPDPGDDSSRRVAVGDVSRPAPAPSSYAAVARAPLAPLPARQEEPPPPAEEEDEGIPAADPGFKKLVLRESDVAAKVAEAREAELAAVVERSARVRTPDLDDRERRRLKRLALLAVVLILGAGTAVGVRAYIRSRPAERKPPAARTEPPTPAPPADRLTKDAVGTRIRRGLAFGLPNAVDAPAPAPGAPGAPAAPPPASSGGRAEGGR